MAALLQVQVPSTVVMPTSNEPTLAVSCSHYGFAFLIIGNYLGIGFTVPGETILRRYLWYEEHALGRLSLMQWWLACIRHKPH